MWMMMSQALGLRRMGLSERSRLMVTPGCCVVEGHGHGRDVPSSEARRARDAKIAGDHAAPFAQALGHIVDLGQDSGGPCGQQLPLVGQGDTAGAAVQQADPSRVSSPRSRCDTAGGVTLSWRAAAARDGDWVTAAMNFRSSAVSIKAGLNLGFTNCKLNFGREVLFSMTIPIMERTRMTKLAPANVPSDPSLSCPLSGLETPCLLVDEARMESNIDRLRTRLHKAGVAFRPHLKTAKSWEISRRLMTGRTARPRSRPCAKRRS
jgi:Predicted amino acid aldolase or racemase